jgi:hypothetical protein
MAIDGYFINGYWYQWLFYLIVAIVLMAIGGDFSNGYWY